MIVYTCPKCGSDLQEVVLASNPPQYKKFCNSCGWSHTTMDDVYRIPYQTDTTSFMPETCKECSNHPRNGGSGICHCTLESFTIT